MTLAGDQRNGLTVRTCQRLSILLSSCNFTEKLPEGDGTLPVLDTFIYWKVLTIVILDDDFDLWSTGTSYIQQCEPPMR